MPSLCPTGATKRSCPSGSIGLRFSGQSRPGFRIIRDTGKQGAGCSGRQTVPDEARCLSHNILKLHWLIYE